MSRALRVAVVGATGALGGEVLSLLEESASELSVESVLPLATSRSQGESVDFRGESLAVRAEAELAGQDLLLCCAPPDASLGWVRKALHAEVPCVDASGALALSTDVPLCAAVLDPQCGVGSPNGMPWPNCVYSFSGPWARRCWSRSLTRQRFSTPSCICLLYTSDAADEL